MDAHAAVLVVAGPPRGPGPRHDGAVLWIGGPPAAGKTTVATLLARRYGLRLYRADTRTWTHRDRALAAGNPVAHRWEALSPRQRWEPPTAELLAMSLHRQRGPMVLADLRALPPAPLVLAEGTTLPAAAADPDRSVWLLPTPTVQRARLAARGTPPGPTRLYLALTGEIEREARDSGVRTLAVDGSAGPRETAAAVAELLGGALAAGPHARTAAERRALLRELNLAVVGQVRGWAARQGPGVDADALVRDFDCECGDPACTATARRTVGSTASIPALAHGPDGTAHPPGGAAHP